MKTGQESSDSRPTLAQVGSSTWVIAFQYEQLQTAICLERRAIGCKEKVSRPYNIDASDFSDQVISGLCMCRCGPDSG